MRDKRYIAIHRGGPLSPRNHHLLAAWAADCAERVLPLFQKHHPLDERPRQAIEAARAWSRGEISVGQARAAAVAAHAAAREATREAAECAARAAGHAVATAHMADHAPGAAFYYALRAVKADADPQTAETIVAQEEAWQMAHLPVEIRELVLSTFARQYEQIGV